MFNSRFNATNFDFGSGPSKFYPYHLKLAVTGPDGLSIFKT